MPEKRELKKNNVKKYQKIDYDLTVCQIIRGFNVKEN